MLGFVVNEGDWLMGGGFSECGVVGGTKEMRDLMERAWRGKRLGDG